MAAQKPFTIIYEDDFFIVINKAPGISVTGERWDDNSPRLNLLVKEKLFSKSEKKLYTVHRIDKEASGIVIFAKDRETHKNLSLAFQSRTPEKTYIAIVHGRPSWKDGRMDCDLPLLPDGNKKHLTIIDKYRGKSSFTAFIALFSAGNYSVVEARPRTGRTHQIRVHLSSLGLPIVCDPLYGKYWRSGTEKGVYLSSFKRNWRGDPFEERPLLERLGLHAASLEINGKTFKAPLPRDMGALIRQMEKIK